MVRVHGRIVFFIFIFAVIFGAQSARASYLRVIDTAAWIDGGRVRLLVQDGDTTVPWKSDVYTSITNLMAEEGVIAFFDSGSSGKRLHAVLYDPGDRSYHHWMSDPSRSYSILTINGGIVACINDTMGSIQAVAYDPGDRSWHEWASLPVGTVTGFTNKEGVISCSMSSSRYAVAAAYDMGDKEWHEWIQGPASLGGVASLVSNNGVVAFLYSGKTIAKAYDPGDQSWHTWTQSLASDRSLLNDETIVAFIHGTWVYGLAYSPADRDWSEWKTDTKNTVTYLSIESGKVVYQVKEDYFTHFVAEAPRAYFVAVKSSKADSLRYQFSDNSIGGIDSWLWTFGDGETSSDRSPMHTYKRAGDYKVTLKVTGIGGNHTRSKTITVPSRVFTLTYKAGSNGSLSGTTTQTVKEGASGTPVTAVPNKGYRFLKWSDGSKVNPRQDIYVAANLTVTATFTNKTAVTDWQLMR